MPFKRVLGLPWMQKWGNGRKRFNFTVSLLFVSCAIRILGKTYPRPCTLFSQPQYIRAERAKLICLSTLQCNHDVLPERALRDAHTGVLVIPLDTRIKYILQTYVTQLSHLESPVLPSRVDIILTCILSEQLSA